MENSKPAFNQINHQVTVVYITFRTLDKLKSYALFCCCFFFFNVNFSTNKQFKCSCHSFKMLVESSISQQVH